MPRFQCCHRFSGQKAGRSTCYHEGMGEDLADRLASLTALDEHGVPVTLGRFWASQPAVLAFIRHFG